MYRTITDFKNVWQSETEATLKCFRTLTDASLGYRSPAFPRGLGRLAQHIAEAPSAVMTSSGLPVDGPARGQTATSTAQLIKDYQSSTGAVLNEVSKWTDADLQTPVTFFAAGRQMQKGSLLNTIITHQAHHRGQLTVLMREAGVPPPGVYGPTIEEWQAMGKEPLP